MICSCGRHNYKKIMKLKRHEPGPHFHPFPLPCFSVDPRPPPKKPPVPPYNEDILPVGRLMADSERYLRIQNLPTPQAISHRIFLFFFHWKESPFTVWMSQVNPIPKGNGIWDGEQIAPRWCWTGQETLEEKKKLACSNTIEDTAVIFAVSRVFIIDFPLRHNGRAIMKSLSFLFFCVARWWGHWLKVAGTPDCVDLESRRWPRGSGHRWSKVIKYLAERNTVKPKHAVDWGLMTSCSLQCCQYCSPDLFTVTLCLLRSCLSADGKRCWKGWVCCCFNMK